MSYVHNTWYVAGWSRDLGMEKPLAMSVLDERIVFYRKESGGVAALEDRCVHRLAPLSLGRREGERLRCMYHGILFDPTGKVVEIPGQEAIPAHAHVRSYPVVERHGWIWVWMGSADLADGALIPDITGLDHPDYIMGAIDVDYEAEAQLISDNLLDFSHVTYVHADSFGLGSDFAQTHAKITPLERGVRYERWMEDLGKNAASQDDAPVDAHMTYDYLLPGVLSMQVASFRPGTAKQLRYDKPANLDDAIRDVLASSQAVTPMGAGKSRYFVMQGIHRRFGDEATRDAMVAVAGKAFEEDKRMIEAQQRVIDDTPAPKIMATAHDRSVVLFNRLVERLAGSEQPAGGAATRSK